MIIKEININESDKWNKIVKSFKHYDVYYLSGYVKAFQLHGDGEPLLIYFENDTTRAMNVVMKRDIAKDKHFEGKIEENKYYDLSTSYGYGGFLIDGDDIGNLNKAYINYCTNHNIISEFVRFHPILCNSRLTSSIYDVYELGRTITIELKSSEQIWSDLSSKNRNKIRKAKKLGVEIYWGRNRELFKEFMPLYNRTMDKDDAEDYYYFKKDFYDSILTDMKYNSLMFYAVYDDKIISMSLILFSNQQMHYHLSASDKAHQHLAPTNLLLYEAACWGCDNGYKTFHLGGGLGSQEDSLFEFKKSFNKNSNTYFSVGKKVFDNEKYQELVDMRSLEYGFDIDTQFFPKYRG